MNEHPTEAESFALRAWSNEAPLEEMYDVMQAAADRIESQAKRIAELEAERDDLDAIARVNAMNMADWATMREERDTARAELKKLTALIERVRASLDREIDNEVEYDRGFATAANAVLDILPAPRDSGPHDGHLTMSATGRSRPTNHVTRG